MAGTVAHDTRPQTRSTVRRAWTAILMTPIGVVAGVVVAYVTAALVGVTLDPAMGHGPSALERVLIWSVASAVWLAAPIAAVVLARRPADAARRSRVTALVVACAVLGSMIVLSVTAIMVP